MMVNSWKTLRCYEEELLTTGYITMTTHFPQALHYINGPTRLLTNQCRFRETDSKEITP